MDEILLTYHGRALPSCGKAAAFAGSRVCALLVLEQAALEVGGEKAHPSHTFQRRCT